MHKKVILLAVLSILYIQLYSQVSYEELKAALVIQFAKHISWQNDSNFCDFTIGFYGTDAATLNEIKSCETNSKIKNKQINVTRINKFSEMVDLQIVYVDTEASKNIKQIAQAIENKKILLVTENCLDKKYLMLNIIHKKENQMLTFEINKANIFIEDLLIEPELLLLGGTEIDIRQLYREMKQNLETEKQSVEQQQKIINQHITEINQQDEIINIQQHEILEHSQQIDSLLITVNTLRGKVSSHLWRLEKLVDSVAQHHQLLCIKNTLLESKDKELNVKNIELIMQTKKLSSLNLEIEDKQTVISNQKAVLNVKETLLETQNSLLYISIAFALALFALGIFIFLAYTNKNRTNQKLLVANDNLELQKKELQQTLNKLNKAQSQLVHSEKMASLGVLVAGIAHEINNPVNFINTSVYGFEANMPLLKHKIERYQQLTIENFEKISSLIKEDEKDIALQELFDAFIQAIESIKIGVERTSTIIKSLCTFAQSDNNHLTKCNLHDYINNTLLILHNKCKNNIEIVKDYGDIPSIITYSGLLNQVLMNIISNAISAIYEKDKKGTITISTQMHEQHRLKITIKDTGIGISKENLFKVFDPFFTTKQVGEGTGLGLYIVYTIVQKLGGKIDVKSVENIGTEFLIELPIELNSTKP